MINKTNIDISFIILYIFNMLSLHDTLIKYWVDFQNIKFCFYFIASWPEF